MIILLLLLFYNSKREIKVSDLFFPKQTIADSTELHPPLHPQLPPSPAFCDTL